MKVNDRIISDLKSRQNSIDKKYGEGSTKKLIELSESLSSLYDERRKIIRNQDISREERINRLADNKKRIREQRAVPATGL